MEKVEDVFKITKDERNIVKDGEKVSIEINQVQEMPLINVKNMVESWKNSNEQMKEYLAKEKEILEATIKEIDAKTKKAISGAEDLIAMNDEQKIEYLNKIWNAQKEKAIKLLKEKDKLFEESKRQIIQVHENMLVKLKKDLKNNEEGIEIYSPVLK